MPCTRRHSGRGFSLIEVIAVLAIIAVAMGYVAVNIGAMTPGTRLTSGARYVGAMINQAKDEAIILGYPVGIGYDLDANEVWLDVPLQVLEEHQDAEETETGRFRIKNVKLHQEIALMSVALDADREYTAGRVVVDFGPLGTGTAHIVHLRSEVAGASGQDCWLRVNALTGEVEMTYSADETFQRRPDPPSFEGLTDADFPR